MLNFNFSAKTDVGLRRSSNEDIYKIDEELGFCLVADGMGGAAAGELASRFFSEATTEVFLQGSDLAEEAVVERVEKAFSVANERILNHVHDFPSHKGMGCTAELLAFCDAGFVLGHMGDSRTYRHRNNQLNQLTRDHSLIQEQVENGILTKEKARTHPMRNVILRAVGINENLTLDLIRGKIQPEDQFLLCSDGLTDMVDEELIQKILQAAVTLHQKVDRLVEMALSAGGKDNITVVLLEA